MKTTQTTATPFLKASTADSSDKSEHKTPGNTPGKNMPSRVTYPDLEEFVPDDCFTTQDRPEYGEGARKSSTADTYVKSENSAHDNTSGKNMPSRVTYPDLEGFVPDDCLTTQDWPEYGTADHHAKGNPS